MRAKAQMCYTDENLGKQMLITTVGINNQREQHMISTIKTVHLTDGINLLEDGEGKYYISYKLHEMNRIRKVYIGWSKTKPIPAKPMYIRGYEAGELEDEVKTRKTPVERKLRLDVLDSKIVQYGTIYVFDAILLADKITAIINVEE